MKIETREKFPKFVGFVSGVNLKEKLNDELFHKLIVQKGDREINFWFRFKHGIIFGSVIFLVALYFLFWYISLDFKTVEDSFTTIFCVI